MRAARATKVMTLAVMMSTSLPAPRMESPRKEKKGSLAGLPRSFLRTLATRALNPPEWALSRFSSSESSAAESSSESAPSTAASPALSPEPVSEPAAPASSPSTAEPAAEPAATGTASASLS